MTDREALLHAIADRPDEPIRQLVFADYLQENGEETRAAFVRLRCEAERVGRESPQYDDLIREGDDVLREHEREWLGAWADRLVDWEFDGGFIRSVRMTANQFEKHGADLFAWEPVERFTFINDDGYLPTDGEAEQLVMHPAFAWVRGIRLRQHRYQHEMHIDGWLRGLSRANHVTRLRELSLNDNGQNLHRIHPLRNSLSRELFRAFCQAEHLRSLEHLVCNELAYAVQGETAGRAWMADELAESRFLPNLRRLGLRQCGLGDAGMVRLADDHRFSALEQLDLLWNTVGNAAWERLLRSPHLGALRDVTVSGSATDVLRERCRRHPLTGLTVSWNDEETDWRAFITACPPLKRLSLWVCNPGRDVFDEMRESGWLRDIEELELRGDSQGNVYGGDHAGVERLFDDPETLPKLRRLTLHELAEEETVEAVAFWPRLSQLESLALTCDYGGRLYVDQFYPERLLTRLRKLSGVRIRDDADAARLTELLVASRIEDLVLAVTATPEAGDAVVELTADGLREFLQSEPLCRVTACGVSFFGVEEFIPTGLALLSDPAALRRVRLLAPSGVFDVSAAARKELLARHGYRVLLHRGRS